MSIRSLALRSGQTSAEDHRLLIGSLLGGADGTWPLDRRGGLLYAPGSADLGGTVMTALVRPFAAAVAGGASPLQGTYLVVSTEDTEVVLEDGPSAGSRTDVIGVVVRDDLYDDSGEVVAEVRVVDPEADESYLPLFEVTVGQGASAGNGGIDWPADPGSSLPGNIRDLRDYTASAGGVVTVPDSAARNRLGEVRDGTLVHVGSTRDLYIRDSGQWRPVAGPSADADLDRRYEPLWTPTLLSGEVYVDLTEHLEAPPLFTGDYYRGYHRVDFPAGTFTGPPSIQLTGHSEVPGTLLEVSFTDWTADGFTVVIARRTTTKTRVAWLAVGA
ncbi:hypothetical protein ACWFMI_09260 [Nocardiopsis terrae]